MTRNIKITLLWFTVLISLAVAALGLETRADNHLGWVLLLAGVGSCLTGTFILAIAHYRQKIQAQSVDRALWLILPGVVLAALIPPLEYLYVPAILPRTILIQEAGLILVITGLLVGFRSYFLLEWWDVGDNQAMLDKHLTRHGMYRLIRFPAYVGLGLIVLGLCLGYSSLAGLIAAFLLLLPGIAWRVRLEDV